MHRVRTRHWSVRGVVLTFAIMFVALIAMAPAAPAGASITNTRADAWGTLELSGSSWLGGNGVNVYSNGPTAEGPSPDTYNYVGNVQSGIKWQCVELVNRLYLSRGWITARWVGNGNQLYNNAPANLAKQPNGSITYISPGDVVTLNNGGLGHAAVVNSVSGSTVQLINQNTTAVYSAATYSGGALTMNGWSGYSVQGVIHAPGNGGSTNHPTGGGAASTRGAGKLDVFIQGTNAAGPNAYRNLTNNAPWEGWNLLENSTSTRITSQPAAVSWNPSRIDLFARGETGDLLHKWYNDWSGWGDWVSMNGCIVGAPTASSWGPNRLDVFAQGCNPTGPNLIHWWWDGSSWGYETVPEAGPLGRITSPPSATSWSVGRIDLFARGSDASLAHKWYNDWSGWGNWVTHGGTIVGAPAVASWAPGRLDVFMVGTNPSGNNLWHNWYDGASWWWELTPGSDNLFITNVLGAVSWTSARIDVFGRDTNGEPRHKFYAGGWSDWAHLGGGVAP